MTKSLKGRVIYYQLGGGGDYIQGGGVGNFFADVLGGVENKITYEQGGGSCISSGIGGGGGHMCSIGLSFH